MRRFEFVEGSSSKFWSPELQGSTFIVTYGRIGTEGQRKEKAFADEASAQREYDKKVAEKLREGYREVGDGGGEASAPVAARKPKEKEAPPSKPVLPPRLRLTKPTEQKVAAAAQALTVLQGRLGKRSWQVGLQARRARRALRRLGGVDPTAHATLGPVFDSLMGRVVAAQAGQRLPLRWAMALLSELDAAVFMRAARQWKQASGGAAVVAREAEALSEPELALRLGLLLTERPELRGGSEAGWQRRWSELKPHLEAHLEGTSGGLQAHLKALATGADTHLAQRVAKLGA